MKALIGDNIEDRIKGQEDIKLQIQGGNKAPHAFQDASSVDLLSLKPVGGELTTIAEFTKDRFNKAVYRDAKFGQAGYVWVKKHALSQALRESYDGSKQLIDGGVV